MNRVIAAMLLVGALLAGAQAQYTVVSASGIQDGAGKLLASGQACFAATDNQDREINYYVGGGGQAIRRPVCFPVVNGALQPRLGESAVQVANSASASPQNFCYRLTVTDSATNREVLRYPQKDERGNYLTSSRCGMQISGSSWSLDTFQPDFSPIAIAQNGPTGPTGATGPTGPAGPPLNPRGAWSSGTTYAAGDLVSYSGGSYAALLGSNTNHQPDTATTWWMRLAQDGTAVMTSGASLPSPTAAGELAQLTTGKKGVYVNRSGSEYTYMFDDLPCVNYVVKADLVYSPSVSGTIDDTAMQACLDAANLYHMNPVVRGPVRLTTALTWANTGWATVNPLVLKCVGSGAGFWWDGTGSSSTWMLSITAGQPIAIDRCGFQSTGYAKAVNAISVNGAKVFLSDIGCGGGNPLYILDCLKLQNSFVGRVDNLYAYGVLGTAIHAVEANGYQFNGVECYVSGLRCAFFDFGGVTMSGYMQGSLKTVLDTAVTSIVVTSNVAAITMAATPAAGSFLTWTAGYRVVGSGASGFQIDCRISAVTDSTHFSCPFTHADGTATGGIAWQAPAAGIELKNGAQLRLSIDDESSFSSLVGAGYRQVLMDTTGAVLESTNSHWCLAACVNDYVIGVGNESTNSISLVGDWMGNGGFAVAFAGPFSGYSDIVTATGLIGADPRKVFGDTAAFPLVSYGAVSGAGYSLNHYNSWAEPGKAGNTTPCQLTRSYTSYWIFGCPGGNADSKGRPTTGTYFADTYIKNSVVGGNVPLFWYTASGGTPGTWARANNDSPTLVTLTDGATVTFAIDGADRAWATVTLGGNRTLAVTGMVSGGSYSLRVVQDGTGSRGLTLGSGCTWKVSGGSGAGAITPSTAASKIDILSWTFDGANCLATFAKDYN